MKSVLCVCVCVATLQCYFTSFSGVCNQGKYFIESKKNCDDIANPLQ